MALIYQPSKRIFCGWFEPLKSTTYSEYPEFARVADADRAFDSRVIGNFQILHGAVVIKRGAARAF